MNYFNYYNKMVFLFELIAKEKTGTAVDLANKLNTSRRSVFRHLDELRDLGADICYCKSKQSYILKNNFDLRNLFS